jgi:HAD superfamily hydrolase (TIGR01549 family)
MDNTLIPWKNEYFGSLNIALDKLGYSYDDAMIKRLINAIKDYEYKYQIYNKQDMLDLMSEYTCMTLPSNFIDQWLEELSLCYEEASDEVINTLEYLYKKYDLVVLTNWFTYSQTNRLSNAGLLKYFSHVYCTDTFPIKPYPESFLKAAGEYKPQECVMIGDSIESDIKGPLKLGMKAIYYDYNSTYKMYDYEAITKFSDLKKIL